MQVPPVKSRRFQRGVTALELLVVIAIVGIFAAFAVPAMNDLMDTSRVRTMGQELRAALVRARSEAINRNTEVRVVPAGADWRNGWLIETTAGDVIQPANTAFARVVTAPAPAPTVVYRVDGRARSGSQVIVISAAGAGEAQPRCVTLSASGRASTRIDTDSDPSNGCN